MRPPYCNPNVIMSGSAKVEMSSLLIDYLLILGGQDGQRGQGLNEREGVAAVACDPSSDGAEDDAGNGERISKAFLQEGNKIQIGNTTFKFTLHDETDHRYQQEIQQRIHQDDLTGLLSLNYFYEQLERRLKQSRQRRSRVTVLMMDLDGLKAVNENHGHLAGSFLIKSVAADLRERLGPLGEVGRYGGDEFIAFVPGLGMEEILAHLENLRSAIAERRFSFKGKPVKVTLSVGLATFPWDGYSVEALVAAAALFSAKQQGKNRVVTHVRE